MKNYDVIIIGGGLSGLTAAYTCQQFGFSSIILERSDRLGVEINLLKIAMEIYLIMVFQLNRLIFCIFLD